MRTYGLSLLRVALVCGIVAAVAASASASPTRAVEPPSEVERLDPVLRRVLARGRVTPALAHLTSAVEVSGAPGVEVVLTAERDIRRGLALHGVRVRTVLGDARGAILTADVPVSALRALSHVPGLRAAHAARRVRRLLDESVPATGAPAVWVGSDDDGTSVTGAGVLVGVVDTGIDYRHPVFQDRAGESRVAAIWDQSMKDGQPPTGYDYGVWCDYEDIVMARCEHRDPDGHGTHVASIAAGRDPEGRFTGMAPDAHLVVVADDGDDASIIDGWSLMATAAREAGLPLVVNNSFGVHDGPHDGTAPLEQALDQLSAQYGTTFVVSAGNEYDQPIHASGELGENASAVVPYSFPEPSPINVSQVTIWYGGEDALSTTVVASDGTRFGPVPRGDATTWEFGEVTVTVDARDPADHSDGNTVVLLEWPEGRSAQGQWALELRADVVTGDGRWDAWLSTGNGAGAGNEGFTGHLDPAVTIVEPACAARAVAVAAYVTKTCWEAMDGEYCIDPQPTLGDITSFSSAGPTRDGRPKPDVAAPGQAVIAARSSAAELDVTETTPDQRFVHQDGTSMAAPHVAGAVALMLQVQPRLDAATVAEVLWETSTVDEITGGVWNLRWGSGRLSARYAALAVGLGPPADRIFLPLAAAR